MKLRAAACGTAALVLGLLAIGPAAAQPYPPYGPPYGPPPSYGPYGPPPVYAAPRNVPPYPAPPELADDELPPGEIPGGAPSAVTGPYPGTAWMRVRCNGHAVHARTRSWSSRTSSVVATIGGV